MAVRAAAAGFGAVFGFAISWGQFTHPDRIRDMLLLNDAYMYLMLGTAVAIGLIGTRMLLRLRARALITGNLIRWETTRPQRAHVVGAAIFGLGWSVSDSCPGPIAAQIAQGFEWSLFTAAGVGLGVLAYLVRQERREGAAARGRRAVA
jgi:uncharacterized membrane protein YedE/YeeE